MAVVLMTVVLVLMPLVLELVASRAVESSGNGGDGAVITSLVSDVASYPKRYHCYYQYRLNIGR